MPVLRPDPSAPVSSPNLADSADFRVLSASDILSLLRQLLDGQNPITLGSPAGAHLTCSLCSVDAQYAALGFEVKGAAPQTAGELQALMQADEVTATAYLDQIRLQFDLEGLMSLATRPSGDSLLLRSNLPTLLYRFQRRQTFRVRPSLRTPHVLLQHPQQHLQQHLQQQSQQLPLRLRILDLSLGGLALWLPPDIMPFEPGSLLPAVQVELNSDTRFQVAMQVQNSQPGEASGHQLGLSFVQINAAAEQGLHLYIEQTQRRTRLLRKS